MYRKCEYCGANLDAGEICDCRKENAAPDGSDPETAQMNIITDNLPNNSEKVKEDNKRMGLKSWKEMREIDVLPHCDYREAKDDKGHKIEVPYLNWAKCKELLHENGAEVVYFEPCVNANGSSLIMCDQVFTDSKDNTNRCYEVRVKIVIDDLEFEAQYPLMNGSNPVKDNSLTQQRLWNAQTRAFVKGVAMRTGLGFGLWVNGGDEADDKTSVDDLSNHNLFSIKERMQITYTNAFKKGMSTKEIAEKVGMTEDEVKVIFTYFDQLHRFEQKLNAL